MRTLIKDGASSVLSRKIMYWICIAFICGCYLIVAVHTPLSILAWQGYDDMLFINHGQSLAEGRWLGKFSELTLVKGPGYPLFLAFNYWLGLPINFTHALFYCFSLVVLSFFVLKISKSYLLAVLLFVITLWDPRVFELNRIMRDAIYSGQAILIITLFSFSLFCAQNRNNQDKLSIMAGLLLGWFWLTREEGIWLIPGLVFLLVFALIRNKYQSDNIKIIRPILVLIFLFGVTQIIFNLGNFIAYGDFVGVDIKEKNFQSALKSMESVRIGDQTPYLSVPRRVRAEIYKISPAFSELKKYIDPEDSASAWEEGGCSFRPTTCGDIGNGFFLWALREAAGKVGYYSSPTEAAKFYELINNDIQHACEDKRLTCEKSHIPYMPPITIAQIKSIPSVVESIWDSISSVGTLYDYTPWKIWGPEYTFNRALSVLNYPTHYPMIGMSSDIELSGWFHRKSKGGDWFTLKVNDDFDQDLPADLTRVESQDLVNSFDDQEATHQRFTIKTRCSDGCNLTFSNSLGVNFIVPIKNAQKFMSNSDATLAFDYINIEKNTYSTENLRVKFSSKVHTFIYHVYKVLLPTLLSIGLLAFAVSCYFAFKKSDYSITLAIAGACWISITVRAAILVLVDISSFPAVTVPYMQPIFALSIMASILSVDCLFKLYFASKDGR